MREEGLKKASGVSETEVSEAVRWATVIQEGLRGNWVSFTVSCESLKGSWEGLGESGSASEAAGRALGGKRGRNNNENEGHKVNGKKIL